MYVDLSEIGRQEVEADAELGQRVCQARGLARKHQTRSLRPTLLLPYLYRLGFGKALQQGSIGLAEGQQVAEHQHRGVLADRNLDLRQAVGDRQGADQLVQTWQHGGDMRRQH
ncbi:hypothetical protein SDC9_208644 [bioreactor metagenome]|uniref:Uncharacterized protein n=1 Tax=bioreactor metagenome TaxID=1076179 RepID=A0A645JB96_9ZZZZ